MNHSSSSVVIGLDENGTITADGVDLDRGSDVASALNAAIRSLPISGGHIAVESGVYDISETITIDRPTVFGGVGPGNTTDVSNLTLLCATDELEGPVIEVNGRNAPDGYMHGTQIKDIGVVGTGDPSTADDCLRFAPSKDVLLTNIFIERALLDSAGRDGLRLENTSSGRSKIKHIEIDSVWSGHHYGDAISLAGGWRYWLTNCYGYDSTVGIRISESVADVSLAIPHCRRNDNVGILVGGGPTQIHGGRVINNDGAGITVRGTDHTTVTHIESFNNTGAGVVVGGAETRTEQTLLTGVQTGNIGGGTEVNVRPTNLPRRLKELGPQAAIEKLRKYGLSNVISGYLPGGTIDKHQEIDIDVRETAIDTRIVDLLSAGKKEASIRDRGIRTVVNGIGRCEGSPIVDDSWGDAAAEGICVVDAESEELYIRAHKIWYGPIQPA